MNPERKNLYRGLSQAAWGYFFLNFDINFNHVSVLPRYVGFLLFPSAISKLSGERRDLILLRPLAVLLGVWAALDWLLSWSGGSVSGHILFLDLLMSAASLYFHFQFLTDMAAVSEQLEPDGCGLSGKICRRRTAYTVLITVTALLTDLPAGLLGGWREGIMVGAGVIACVVAVAVMLALFELRRYLAPLEPQE